MSNSEIKLSDLQLTIMKVIWEHGKLSVSEIHQLLNQHRELALTTVATMLKRMQEKSIVAYEKQGRQHLYYPLISENEVKTSMLNNILRHLFDGKSADLVHHLVGQDDVSKDDLEKIRQLLVKGKES